MAKNWLSQIDEYEDGYSVDGSLFRTLSTLAYNIDLQYAPTITPYGTKVSNLVVVDSYKIGRVATVMLSYTLNGTFAVGEKIANIAGALSGYGAITRLTAAGVKGGLQVYAYGLCLTSAQTFRNETVMTTMSVYYP